MRTALYRHFDADNRLLYVGVTGDPDKRDREHLAASGWRAQTVRLHVEWCLSREHALALERVAVRFEAPIHNKAHAHPKPAVCDGREAALVALIDDAAVRLGVAPATIGERAGQGGQFYTRLLSGAGIRPQTDLKVREWIAANTPEAGQ